VDRDVILHEGHIRLPASFDVLIEDVDIRVCWVSIAFSLLVSAHNDQIRTPSDPNSTPYHDAYAMAFRIGLYKFE
jgi:hypothetical protein